MYDKGSHSNWFMYRVIVTFQQTVQLCMHMVSDTAQKIAIQNYSSQYSLYYAS